MVVQLVVSIILDTMQSKVLYPADDQSEERVALLVGIAQLVQTALQKGDSEQVDGEIRYMKSDVGTIGYAEFKGILYICEADSEGETVDVIKNVLKSAEKGDDNLTSAIQKSLHKKGREISSLWG